MLTIKISPPQHPIDDPPMWIARTDCWDNDRIIAEKAKLDDAATHPVERWYSGATRWSLSESALLTVPEALRGAGRLSQSTVTIREYLLAEPTCFEMRVLSPESWRAVFLADRAARAPMLVKHGLARVVGAEGGNIEPDRGASGIITAAWLAAFDIATRREIVDPLATAIFELAEGKVGAAEGKL